MRIGYIRADKRMGEAPQRKILEESGLEKSAIYVETDNGSLEILNWIIEKKMRQTAHDTVDVAYLHRLHSNSDGMAMMIKRIMGRGGVVVEAATGTRSDDSLAMVSALHDSIAALSGRLSGTARTRIGKAGAAASPVTKPKSKRMPAYEAIQFWHDLTLHSMDAIGAMNADDRYLDKWSYASAYRHLGPRGIPAGPRSVKRIAVMQEHKRKRTPRGQVYFARIGGKGHVKIGFSVKVGDRMKMLNGGNHKDLVVLRTMDATPQRERELHEHFAKYRVRREWFRFTGELRAFILSLPDNEK